MSKKFSYCPICQLPLQAISISPDAHVSMCMSRSDEGETKECPKGVHCLSTDIFHYRDFSHKFLAAYRSSADFIPPDIDIKPSPKKRKTPQKRISPRKKKTPPKPNVKSASDDESDSEILVQTKKPRRNLKFSEQSTPKSNSVENKIDSAESCSKRVLRSVSNKTNNNSSPNAKTKTAKQRCRSLKNISLAEKESDRNKKPTESRSSIVNVNLIAGAELRFTKSRSLASLTSMSVTTSENCNVESDLDSETTSGSSKQAVNTVNRVVLKQPVLTLENLKIYEQLLESKPKEVDAVELSVVQKQSKSVEVDQVETETIGSIYKTDFDDVIPGSMLDKDLLKTIEKHLDSPATTVHSCSEYNGTATSASSVTEGGTTEDDNENVEALQPPSSPEVIIPSKPRKKFSAFLTSSSDSDVPLSKLITNRQETALNRITSIKGKVKAGKVLRTPNKTPTYLNGSSVLKSELNTALSAGSDKESDSGKSSAHTDISFIPSEKTSSSSQHSDSALSAQSTDRLTASSASSTYTSSESYSESRSSDPSYSEESDAVANLKLRKSKDSPKHDKKLTLTHRMNKRPARALSSLSEDCTSTSSSSSEISAREKVLFGSKKTPPNLKESHVQTKQPFKTSTLGLLDTTDSDDKSEWQSLLSKMRSGCFPSDLKIDSEDSLTVVSSCSGSDTSHASAMLPPRQCPFYKKIPDTPFVVDAFQYWNIPGVKVYFLSHFHSDHYIGLKKNFAHPIYCTRVTANLVRMKLRVDEKWLRIIEINQPQIICGVEVTALDANHCPGSVMFLFSLTNGQSHLHVGDFRASKAMTFHPAFKNVSISKLFLDTTYCSPQYCFPTQEEVIGRVVEIVRKHVASHPKTLVVCGSYTIGKEKVFLGIAEAMDWCVWARPEKQRVFACLNDPRISERLVKDCRTANIHVLPMASLQMRCLQQHLESCTGTFTHVIGIKPTGWELDTKSNQFKVTSRENITIYGVPYSEHSSFTELRDFVQFLQPHEIVPTVNVGSAASRGKMSKHFSDWLRTPSHPGEKQTKVSQYFKTSF